MALVREAPHDAAAHRALGRAMAQAGRHVEAAQTLTEAARLDPDDAPCWAELGASLIALGRPEDALAAFEASLECDPTIEATFIRVADAKFRLRRFADTLAYVRAMPLLAVTHPELPAIEAASLLALGRDAEARIAAEHAVARFPANPALLTLLAALETVMGESDTAEPMLRRALALTPDSYDTLAVLAVALDAKGDAHGAVRLLQRAHTLDPTRFEAPFALAAIAFVHADIARLDEWTAKGLEAAPLHPRLLFLRAWVEAHDGNRKLAESMLRAAVVLDPNHQATHFALARLLLCRGEQDAAAYHLDATMRLDPANAQGQAAAAMIRALHAAGPPSSP